MWIQQKRIVSFNSKVFRRKIGNILAETLSECLKSRLCFGDLNFAQNAELMSELIQLRSEFTNLSNTYKELKRENNSLRTTLTRYEASDNRPEEEAAAMKVRPTEKVQHLRTLQKPCFFK